VAESAACGGKCWEAVAAGPGTGVGTVEPCCTVPCVGPPPEVGGGRAAVVLFGDAVTSRRTDEDGDG
jgi:hypothetical protein